jgi:hypothetical protein
MAPIMAKLCAYLLMALMTAALVSGQPLTYNESKGHLTYRESNRHPREGVGVIPLTKAQTRRALAEHRRLVQRNKKQAIKDASPDEDAYSANVKDGRHCAAGFRQALAAFKGGLSAASEVVLPKEKDEYNTAREFHTLRNVMYDNKPVAIVYLGTEADAVVVTDMAEAAGCRVCGRAGAHDSAGASVCPGGIVADVSRLKEIQVDVGQNVSRFQAGVVWGEVNDALGPQGIACITGLCPVVGVAGFTLGGGWGALSKLHGLGSDNVLSYNVAIPGAQGGLLDEKRKRKNNKKNGALAGAELVVADATGPYSDLFFALRGAGHSSFGIVTSMTYKNFYLPTVAVAQVTFNDLEANSLLGAQALYLWQQQFLNQPPLELAIYPNVGDNGNTSTFDLVFAAMYGSSDPEAQTTLVEALQPFLDMGGQLAWAKTLPYNEAKSAYGGNIRPPPLQINSTDPNVYWEYKLGQYVSRPLTVEEFHSIIDGMLTIPVLKRDEIKGGVQVQRPGVYRLGFLEGNEGAAVVPAPTDTAFVHRSVGFNLAVMVIVPPAVPGALTAGADWLLALFQDRWAGFVGPEAYQNYPSVFYQPRRRALEQYYGENTCRLVSIKEKYDPGQVFGWLDDDKTGGNNCGNQGIPPTLPGC